MTSAQAPGLPRRAKWLIYLVITGLVAVLIWTQLPRGPYSTDLSRIDPELGEIQRPTGELDAEGNPISAPVAAPDGTPYLHANLRTPISLGAVARKLAATDPEVAEAMQRLDRYFLLDDEGTPRLPRQPVRVWF